MQNACNTTLLLDEFFHCQNAPKSTSAGCIEYGKKQQPSPDNLEGRGENECNVKKEEEKGVRGEKVCWGEGGSRPTCKLRAA